MIPGGAVLLTCIYFCLKDYRQTHPEVTVLDPPDAIQHVYNRQFMLQDVADLNLSDAYGNCYPTLLGSMALEISCPCFLLASFIIQQYYDS